MAAAAPVKEEVVESDAEVDLMATTTRTKDYIGRLLVNATPGTSQATDFLGRAVTAGDKDYLGRALVA